MFGRSRRARKRFNPWITIVVTAVLAVLLGVLFKENYSPVVSEAEETLKVAHVESDDWFLIRMRGSYSGFGRSRQYKEGDRWVIRDDLNISLNIQGRIKPVRITSRSVVDKDYRLLSFDLTVRTGIVSFEQKGRVEGDTLVLTSPDSLGGGEKRLRIHKRPRISRSLGLPAPLTDLEVGDNFKIPIFDPIDGRKWEASIAVLEKMELQIGDRLVEAWKVNAIFRAMEVIMWVDEEGRLLKGRMPLGITVVRSDRKEIESMMRGVGDLPEMMTLSSVPTEGTIADPRNLGLLKVEIIGKSRVHIPSDNHRQTVKKNVVTIRRRPISKPSYSVPYERGDRNEYLESSRFIRSDHPDIVKKAKEIAGDEKDPAKAVRMINHWVFERLRKTPTPSVPDAYTVLVTRQGDCNEHSVLAAAFARALGIPARIDLGLVYLEDAFYYHAWNSYWDGNSWFTADALLDQMPVDATHVRLLTGDVDKHLNVITFLGKLEFKILEAE